MSKKAILRTRPTDWTVEQAIFLYLTLESVLEKFERDNKKALAQCKLKKGECKS